MVRSIEGIILLAVAHIVERSGIAIVDIITAGIVWSRYRTDFRNIIRKPECMPVRNSELILLIEKGDILFLAAVAGIRAEIVARIHR